MHFICLSDTHCLLCPETQHVSQVGKPWLQRWMALLRCRLGSVFGWSLLFLLVLQITCVSMPVSCDGVTAAKREMAGVSSCPPSLFGTWLSCCSSPWVQIKEHCPKSSVILGQLVDLGRASLFGPRSARFPY